MKRRPPRASASGEAALIGGGSDASTAHAMGIAAIDGLGPRGIGFHTKDEQIEIRTLVQKAQGARALPRIAARDERWRRHVPSSEPRVGP